MAPQPNSVAGPAAAAGRMSGGNAAMGVLAIACALLFLALELRAAAVRLDRAVSGKRT